jgi:hypothetical protein
MLSRNSSDIVLMGFSRMLITLAQEKEPKIEKLFLSLALFAFKKEYEILRSLFYTSAIY